MLATGDTSTKETPCLLSSPPTRCARRMPLPPRPGRDEDPGKVRQSSRPRPYMLATDSTSDLANKSLSSYTSPPRLRYSANALSAGMPSLAGGSAGSSPRDINACRNSTAISCSTGSPTTITLLFLLPLLSRGRARVPVELTRLPWRSSQPCSIRTRRQ
jgi:hypothetical protein